MTAFQVGGTTVIGTSRQITLGTATPGSPATGMIRYNSSLTQFEVHNGSAWVAVVTTGGGTASLWSWGTNRAVVGAPYNIDTSTGAVGDFTNVNRSSPVTVVGGITDWGFVSTGSNCAFAIRNNGTAWTWGVCNPEGSMGINAAGAAAYRSSPTSIVGEFTDWVSISSVYSTFGLRANGTIWSWGRNQYGILGAYDSAHRSSPISIVGGITDWIQVDTGDNHVLALRANGTAWAWGIGSNGRLGDNRSIRVDRSSPISVVGGFTDWVQLSADSHSLGLRANGTLWSWGYNSYGQLGINTSGGGSSGADRSSPTSVVGGFTDWVFVTGRGNKSGAIRANGTLWTWGINSSTNAAGSLGVNDTIDRSSPTSVVGGFTDWTQLGMGIGHTLGVRANGTAWAWGQNTFNIDAFKGTLGDGTEIDRSSPVSVVGGYTDWVQVAASNLASHGLRAKATPDGGGGGGGTGL